MIALDFGCLPIRLDLRAGDIAITTRADFADTMDGIEKSGRVHDGWMYPTLPTLIGKRYGPFPYPEPRYVLPLTHELRHDGMATADQLHFLIGTVGFLLGFRLLPDGYGYLQRTPMRSGLTTDLGAVDAGELAFCLPHADATWVALSAGQRQALRAVIVAYQTALAYRHAFEQFTFLYSALDAAWLFHRRARGLAEDGAHSARPVWICTDVLGIPVPDWAELPPKVSSQRRAPSPVAATRNRLTHEAVFEDEPLGYASQQGPLLDMQALVSRAIVKALGIPCGYVSSPTTSQQTHGLDLAWPP